ncbi:hypothetical protein [Haladaptatus sp. NG-SE-30]
MVEQHHVSDEYRNVATPFFQELLLREQWAADVYGYWMHQINLDQELRQLKFKLGKTVYDEVRHANICEKMVRHLGGQDAVDEMYDQWCEQGQQTWVHRMNRVFTKGIPSYIEFLSTVPLFADSVGIQFFADLAENTNDPVIADTVESISEDERLHSSLSAEFLPVLVERHGNEARKKIEQGLELWLPVMYGIQGHPDSEARNRMIESGFLSLTNEEIHEIMRDHASDILNPLGIDIPKLDRDEYLKANEVADYSERVMNERIERGEL